MNVLMIMNPISGKLSLVKHYKEIVELLQEAGFSLDVRCTTGKGSAQEIIKNNAEENDIIICCGGDGTLNDIINGLMTYNISKPVGYIPCGTTNDFATSLKISKNMVKAAKDITSGSSRLIDVGKFGNTYFSYVAFFGAFSQSSYSTPQNMKNILGHFAYILEGMKELPFIRPITLSVTTETGEIYKGEFALGAIANSTSIGGIIKLDSTIVDMSDGVFEILLIKYPKNIMDFNNIITSLQTNDFENPSICFFRAKEVTIESDEPIQWSLDGECFDANKIETIKNCHKAINIILPNKNNDPD